MPGADVGGNGSDLRVYGRALVHTEIAQLSRGEFRDASDVIPLFPCAKSEACGQGLACEDRDECAESQADCGANAQCSNTDGSFSCSCHEGFAGDGLRCENVDECASAAHECDEHAVCTDSVGGYACACNVGFAGSGRGDGGCSNVDECGVGGGNTCDAMASCVDNEGSFECTCDVGWAGPGTNCSDVDECARGAHACTHSGT
eukprot:3937985-Rhodomonas_salina.1